MTFHPAKFQDQCQKNAKKANSYTFYGQMQQLQDAQFNFSYFEI